MDSIDVKPAGIDGEFAVPGSKSLTARALVAGALAEGKSGLVNASTAGDTATLLAALRALGFEASEKGVVGKGGVIPAKEAALDAGNAGTAFRFLAALLCTGGGRYRLDGDARMRQRPVGPLVDALRSLGASIRHAGAEGFPPLDIEGRGLFGGSVKLAGDVSSQFVSALLLAAPLAHGPVEIEVVGRLVSRPYVDLTIQVMSAFGAPVQEKGARYIVHPKGYQPRRYIVEPDAGAAGYFFARAAVTGGRASLRGLGSGCRQPEYAFVADLERMGCAVTRDGNSTEVCGGPLRGIDVDMADRPDSVPTLAVVALFAKGPTTIRGVAHLRHKESDRLAALAAELAKTGARVVETTDGLEIEPPATLKGAEIETYADHRMAMSFAVAGSAAPGFRILKPDVVAKSHPEFWTAWGRAGASAGTPPRP